MAVPILLVLAFGAPGQEDRPQLGRPPGFPVHSPQAAVLEPIALEAIGQQPSTGPLTAFPQNRENSLAFFAAHYSGAAAPPIAWTGSRASCDAGTTAADFRDAVARRINYFRAMGGVPARILLSGTCNAKAQQAALMMSVNNQLSHDPPDTWQCYSADGDEAAHNSNLALGAYGWGAITLYMQDPGTGNGAAGHRRWILYPQTQTMGTGDLPASPASNDLWVFDSHMWDPRPATREAFVAWPPPGYVPYQVVFPRWSFSYPSANLAQSSVTMTLNQQNLSVALEAVANGYGENTLVWIPNGMSSWDSWPRPAADARYQVTVNNVVIQGSPYSFSYDVTVVDPSVFVPTTAQDLVDLDADGKTDPAVWRPGNGVWYGLSSGSPGSYSATPWGLETDIPVPADYDGDRKTDLAVWRPAEGIWYIRPSGAPETQISIQWGVPTDEPVPADYDGDGKTDIAVWRPATGTWYALPSSLPGTFRSNVWGISTDVPVPADYDGDLKTDIAVWRPGTGVWYVLPSGSPGSFDSIQWGSPSDTPVPSDYDGDGEADIAVRRPGTGVWYVLPSNSPPGTFTATQWGLASDTPAPADYDGDGKSDVAVWRAGSAVWYVIPSKAPSTFTSTPWGLPGDQPLSPISTILRLIQ